MFKKISLECIEERCDLEKNALIIIKHATSYIMLTLSTPSTNYTYVAIPNS